MALKEIGGLFQCHCIISSGWSLLTDYVPYAQQHMAECQGMDCVFCPSMEWVPPFLASIRCTLTLNMKLTAVCALLGLPRCPDREDLRYQSSFRITRLEWCLI